jgi:hypothetical protein
VDEKRLCCGDSNILRASFKAPGVLWTSSAIAFPWRAFFAFKGKKREAIVCGGLSIRDQRLGERGRSLQRFDCISMLFIFALLGDFWVPAYSG